jgi:hypothetical protein
MSAPMKTIIKFTLAGLAIVACCAAVSSLKQPAVPYHPEQTKDNIRVTLLRVDRTTVFTDVGFSETKPQKIHAIPGLAVVYAVEILGDEPIKNWRTTEKGKLVSVNGQPIDRTTPENVSGGGHNSSHEYEHFDWGMMKKPTVKNPKRTHVVQKWERGLRVPKGRIDLHLTTGINERDVEFEFKDVPVE